MALPQGPTVDDYSRRITPLRATEADLKAKRAEVAGELDHQTAVLAKPEEVLQFASQLSDFLESSSPKDRKQMLNRFIKCIWIEPGKGTKGDLLFNRTNSRELVGKVGLFDGHASPVTFASYLVRMRPHSSHEAEY